MPSRRPSSAPSSIGGSPYPVYRLVVMAISLAAIVATFLVFFRTRLGLAARAVIANRDMAACLGIDTRRLDRLTFAFGAGLAGLAGAVMAPLVSIDPNGGLGWLVPAFLSILVGGLGSIAGPLAGGAAVGGVDSLTAALASPVMGSARRARRRDPRHPTLPVRPDGPGRGARHERFVASPRQTASASPPSRPWRSCRSWRRTGWLATSAIYFAYALLRRQPRLHLGPCRACSASATRSISASAPMR